MQLHFAGGGCRRNLPGVYALSRYGRLIHQMVRQSRDCQKLLPLLGRNDSVALSHPAAVVAAICAAFTPFALGRRIHQMVPAVERRPNGPPSPRPERFSCIPQCRHLRRNLCCVSALGAIADSLTKWSGSRETAKTSSLSPRERAGVRGRARPKDKGSRMKSTRQSGLKSVLAESILTWAAASFRSGRRAW